MKAIGTTFLHFSGSGADVVEFGDNKTDRLGITNLILTTSGGVNMSFDGTNFIPVTNGTHQFTGISLKKLYFNAGTWAGIGIRL